MDEDQDAVADEIGNRLLSIDTSAEVELALLALAAAAKRLRELSPLDFISFLRAWQEDRYWLQEAIGQLSSLGTVAEAASYLGLSEMIGEFSDRKRPGPRRSHRLDRADSSNRLRIPAYPR